MRARLARTGTAVAFALAMAAGATPASAQEGADGYAALEGLIGDTYRNFTEGGREGAPIPGGVFEAVETTPVDNFNRTESWAWEGEITGRMLFVGTWPSQPIATGPDPGAQLFGTGTGGLFDCSSTGAGRQILCPPGDDGSQFAGGAKFIGLQFAGDIVAGGANNDGEIGLRFDRRGTTNYEGDPQFYDLFDGADCFIVSRFNRTQTGPQFMPPIRIDYTGNLSDANPFPESPTGARVHLGGNAVIFALPLDEPCINAQGAGAFTFVAGNGLRRPGSVTSYVTPPLPDLFALDNVATWSLTLAGTDEAADDTGVAAPATSSTDTTSGVPDAIWVLSAAVGLLGAGYGVTRIVRRRDEETDPTALTVEDLQQYEDFGIETDVATARAAQALADEKESDLHRAEQHAVQLERDRVAQAADIQPALQAPPPPPVLGAHYVTDSQAAEFAYSFFNEVASDFTTGKARDRLYYFFTNLDDGVRDGASGLATQIETAYEGWGNIFNNPSSLGELDEAAGDAIVQIEKKAGELNAAALAGDDEKFGSMVGNATGQAVFQATLGKGMQAGQTVLVNRLGGSALAGEGAAATATTATTTAEATATSTTQTATRAATGVRPPTSAAATPRPPAPPPAPTPTATTPRPTGVPVNGYGPRAVTGRPVRGGGTPAQANPWGCGAAVIRGLLADLGLAVPLEAAILAMGRTLGVWSGTGLTPFGLVRILSHYLPKNVRLFATNMMGLRNKAFNIGQWMKLNPKGEVIVGIRWGGAGTKQLGHFVRVEAVRNGWVFLGDPQFAFVSVAVPEAVFNYMVEVAVVVVP